MKGLRESYGLLSAVARRRLWLLLTLMVFGAFAEMVSLSAIIPFLTLLVAPETASRLPLMGQWLAEQPRQDANVLVGGLFLIALLVATLVRIWLLHATTQFAQLTGHELTKRAFKTILAQPYVWHVQYSSSHQITQLNRVNEFVAKNIQPSLVLITSMVLGCGILAVLFANEPVIMSLMTLMVSLFYVGTVVLVRRRIYANGHLINAVSVTKVRLLQESLGGIRDVILDHSQAAQTNRFAAVELVNRKALIANEWIAQLPRYLIEFFGIVTIVMLALAFSQSGNTPVATLGLLALGSQRLLPLAQKIYESLNTLTGAEAARIDVISLLSLSDQIAPDPQTALPFRQQLQFTNVYFRYPSSKEWVLKNLSFTLRKGERVGIVGPSGGGKSTLMDIMMGLLEPTEGYLVIDGHALCSEQLPAWRRRIAHVPQNIFLLDASLRENIALGVPNEQINEAQLARSIQQAQLDDVVNKLPKGQHTLIGERGVLLSGGQRQRIGIARALYRQADVLVMDEATSALDHHTEAEVIAAIESLGPDITIVMIAHRLTTLAFCDRTLKIIDGQLQ